MHALTRKLTLALALQASIAPSMAVAVDFAGQADGAATGISPGPTGVGYAVSAQGRATHLGLFTREEKIFLDPKTGALVGTIVFTTSDGHQLNGQVSGNFVGPGKAVGVYTLAGGTGRFANSVGRATFELATLDGIRFSATFSGTLEEQVPAATASR